MRLKKIALAGAFALAMGSSQAALIDRGGGLIYDTDLNITWLQNANYGAGSIYDQHAAPYVSWKTDGKMTWSNAMAWADTLVYHDNVRDVDYSNWRLPTSTGVGGECVGYNCANSEMGHLFFIELGNKAIADIHGNYQSDYGLNNVGPFIGLKPGIYWSSTQYACCSAYSFYMYAGYQVTNANGTYYEDVGSYAWAVRDGDVAVLATPVPEPETYAMMLAGLGLLGFMGRRRKQKIAA